MEHQKEWHTCDRCGEEIGIKPKSKVKFTLIGRYSDIKPTFEECDIGAEIEKIHTFKLFNRKCELCPKCRKDFERFMKNESMCL